MASDITVLSWNINSLKKKLENHKTALLKIFKTYDIVLLQETKIGQMKDGKDYPGWNTIYKALSKKYDFVELKDQTYRERSVNPQKTMEEKKGTMYMTYFRSDSKGVAILINKPHTLLKASCEGGDYAWVHVQIGDQKYTFVSVYYHKDYPDLICNLMLKIFYSLKDGLDVFKHRPVIGGDFNTTLDPRLDVSRENKAHAARRDRLKEFMRIVKLSDVWRKKHKSDPKPTYTRIDKTTLKNEPESKPKNKRESEPTMSRLDYVFMLKNDVKYVRSCEILSEITLSDHSPVSLTLNYPNTNDRNIQQPEE